MNGGFSMAWKTAEKSFHTVEKTAGIFPYRGKPPKIFSIPWKTCLLGWAAAVGAAANELPAPPAADRDWGPLAVWQTDADGAARFRAAGPFWETAASPDGKTLRACPRPLWVRATDPATDRNAWDFLWPVAAGKTYGREKSWRFLMAFFFDRDRGDPASQYRFWLPPFWYHGRMEDGKGYAALFPLGGTIGNFLLRDRIRFFLWPLWAQSQLHEVKTTDVLWPIYSRTTSPDGHREQLRIFPLYGYSKSGRQYVKHAVLWPLWSHGRYVHPKATGTAWVLFPLCGRVNLNCQKGWMVFPPFFQFIRGDQLSRFYCPWPFFQRETGIRERFVLWPLYGYRRDETLVRHSLLWLFFSREQNDYGRKRLTRWQAVPFFTSVSQAEIPLPAKRGEQAVPPPGPLRATANRTKLWPLYSRRYDRDAGSYRLRVPELWPVENPPPVERSWAPLWTLLDYRAQGPDSDLDVLWGLYRATRRGADARAFTLFPLWRHDRAAGDAARRWSVLKGLIAYDRTATNRQVRFLWLGRLPLRPAPRAEAPATPNP